VKDKSHLLTLAREEGAVPTSIAWLTAEGSQVRTSASRVGRLKVGTSAVRVGRLKGAVPTSIAWLTAEGNQVSGHPLVG
jgi:hypothetical protein